MFGEIITVYCDSCRKHKNIHVVKMRSFYVRSLASSCLSVCLSVCPSVHLSAWNNLAPTRRIFVKFNTWVFFKNLPRKFMFH